MRELSSPMTNRSSPGPWPSERKSVSLRKLAKLELIPVEIMRTQAPTPWLHCDLHVRRTMAAPDGASRIGIPPHHRAAGQGAAAAGSDGNTGQGSGSLGAHLRYYSIWSRGPAAEGGPGFRPNSHG